MRLWTYLLISISYLMAGLLTYTATKKLMDYESHLAHIRDIELISHGLAVWAARAVIAVEYGLAIVLLVPLNRVEIWGWKAVVLLMAVYCYYIYHVLHYAPFVPCSCHGIDKRLTWGQQFDINLGLAALALLILGLYYRKWIRQKTKLYNIQNSLK